MSSEKPDQIQASVAAALSRLRGDLGPSGATAPKIDEQQASERARPANDVRGDPFFRSIQSPPPGTGMTAAGRAPIPMTPFPRMQATQGPAGESPSSPPPVSPPTDDHTSTPEPTSTIEIPEMPEPATSPDLVAMPELRATSSEASQPAPQSHTQAAAPQAPAGKSPLSRVMRGTAGLDSPDPAQRDLLAELPPPLLSEPLAGESETIAMRRRRRNRRLLAVAAVIAVVAVGAWLWTGSTPSTDVPVVAAETTPEKVKPADEGGLQVQNQDVQVLDPSAQTQGETVMPEPEQPITPPAATAPTDTAGTGQAPTIVENAAPEGGATAEAPAVDAPPAPGTPLAETPLPALEEEAATKAESAPAAPAVTAPEPAQPAQTAEAPAQSEPVAGEPTASESSPSEQASAPAAAEPAPNPTQAPEAAQQPEAPTAQEAPAEQAAVTPAAPTGNTRIQLAAGKSEASVQKEWAALQKAHPQLLGALSLTVERVDKGTAGTFYRLQAGPLADKAAGRQLCASLKQRGQDCIVVTK